MDSYVVWTFVRSGIRALLFLLFIWPPLEERRTGKSITAAFLIIFLLEAVRILPILNGGGLEKALSRQILLVLGPFCAALLLLKIQKLYAFYIASVFSFSIGMWKNLVTPYVFQPFVFPAAFVADSLSFTQPVRTLLETIVSLLTLLLIKKAFFNMERDRQLKGNQVFLVLFPVFSNWVIMVALYDSFFFDQMLLEYRNGKPFMLVFLLLVVSSVFTIVIAEWYFRMDKKREQMRREQQLLEDYYSRIEAQRKADENLRLLKHDMKNHLTTLSAMHTGSQEAAAYIQTLISKIQHNTSEIQSGNPTLDVVLNQKQSQCRELGLVLQAYVNFKPCVFMEAMEICTLFANCIDNAMEATLREHGENRVITVSCGPIGGCMVAKFSNPCSAGPIYKNGTLQTTKDDPARHGYGLKSVARIVEAHGGALRINHENSTFITTWMLPLTGQN